MVSPFTSFIYFVFKFQNPEASVRGTARVSRGLPHLPDGDDKPDRHPRSARHHFAQRHASREENTWGLHLENFQ